MKTAPNLGPLTATVRGRAGWASSKPNCPSSQEWADEFERVFSYADSKQQFARYFNRLTSNSYSQFDSSLAELRIAYFLESRGFIIADWEPVPKSGNAGEFSIACPSGEPVFVEVKSPGWESELEEQELKAGRTKQEKYLDGEGRWVEPYKAVQFAIRKSYKKFDPCSSNLLVVADDLFVSLQNDPDRYAHEALYATGAYFGNSAYQNLGGIGVFWVEATGDSICYRIKTYINPHALSTAALPNAALQFLGNRVPQVNRNA